MALFTAAEIQRQLCSLTYEHLVLQGATIDHEDLTRWCPLDYGRHNTPSSSASTTGIFATLPAEIYRLIFMEVDVESLVALRSTNRYIRDTIDAFPEYRAIVEHVPHILRTMLSVGTARSFTWKQLHGACSSEACVACGEFGGLLYLLTCSRVCLHCLVTRDQYQPMISGTARGLCGLDRATQLTLPTVRSLPGDYGAPWWRKWCATRIPLVDREAARQAGIALHGSDTAMTTFVTNKRVQLQARYQQRLNVYYATPADQRPSRLPSCPPRHDRPISVPRAHRHRFMCVVRAPKLSHHGAEWGRACAGCEASYISNLGGNGILLQDRRRLYTMSGYIAHFANCPRSQETMEIISQVEEIMGRADPADRAAGWTPELRGRISAWVRLRRRSRGKLLTSLPS